MVALIVAGNQSDQSAHRKRVIELLRFWCRAMMLLVFLFCGCCYGIGKVVRHYVHVLMVLVIVWLMFLWLFLLLFLLWLLFCYVAVMFCSGSVFNLSCRFVGHTEHGSER